RGRRNQSSWQNVDAVAVIVEGCFVDKVRADRIGRVDHSGIRRIAKGVSSRRNVVAAPHAGRDVLRNRFGNERAINRELTGGVVINAGNLFPQAVGCSHWSSEMVAIVRRRENPTKLAAGGQQRLSVGVEEWKSVQPYCVV